MNGFDSHLRLQQILLPAINGCLESAVAIACAMRKIRLGVLGSGSGSNFQALLDASQSGTLDAQIVLVLSDVVGAGILERARNANIPTGLIDCRGCTSKFPLEAQQETAGTLKKAAVDLVCLAGFMRMIKSPLLEAFPGCPLFPVWKHGNKRSTPGSPKPAARCIMSTPAWTAAKSFCKPRSRC